MKMNHRRHLPSKVSPHLASSKACRGLAAKLDDVKRTVLREHGDVLREEGALLQSALKEAEALAWQTPYPYLFFPVLAEEKAAFVNHWAQRQRRVRQETLAFAA